MPLIVAKLFLSNVFCILATRRRRVTKGVNGVGRLVLASAAAIHSRRIGVSDDVHLVELGQL